MIPFQATLEPQNPAQRAPGGKSAAFLHQCQGVLCSHPLPEEGNSGQGGILRPLSPQLFPLRERKLLWTLPLLEREAKLPLARSLQMKPLRLTYLVKADIQSKT